MKRYFSKIFLSLSLVVASAFMSAAMAGGDLVAERPAIWSGFYVGLHAGYASVDHDADFGDDFNYDGPCKYKKKKYCVIAYDADNDADGPLVGVHLGYNVQRGHFLFGIEGDYSKTTSDVGFDFKKEVYRDYVLKRSKEKSLEIDMEYLASLRARAGWARDNYLLYVTGGIAWTKLEADFTKEKYSRHYGLDSEHYSDSESLTGYVIGAGGAYMLSEGVSLRGEVLHYEFDDKDIEFDSTVVRGGITLHLN